MLRDFLVIYKKLYQRLLVKKQIWLVQVGPRMSFTTAWSANAVSICASCGLGKVTRIEPSRRYQLQSERPLSESDVAKFAVLVLAFRPVPLQQGLTPRHAVCPSATDPTALPLLHLRQACSDHSKLLPDQWSMSLALQALLH